MGIYLNDEELLALSNSSGIAVKAYLRMRARMDLRTRLVGVMSGISWPALIEWTETTIPKGAGVQVEKPSESAVRRAVAALERVGLVQKRKSAVLVFSLPMASAGEVRPNQTRQETDRRLSTKPGAKKYQHLSGFAGGFEAEPDTHKNTSNGPNPTHIGGLGFTSSESSSTDSTGVNASGGDAAPGGPYRDRPAGSQASSLERPGETQESPDRDRPLASRPARPGRFGGRSEPECIRLHAGQHGTPGSLAESESTAADCAGGDRADALKQVLSRRGIRIPAAAAGSAVLDAWVGEGVTPLELDGAVEAALDARRKAESLQPVGLAYVGRIVQSKRSEARRAAKAVTEGRKQSVGAQAFEHLARSMGMWPARMGETWDDFRKRVYAAADKVVSGDGAGA